MTRGEAKRGDVIRSKRFPNQSDTITVTSVSDRGVVRVRHTHPDGSTRFTADLGNLDDWELVT